VMTWVNKYKLLLCSSFHFSLAWLAYDPHKHQQMKNGQCGKTTKVDWTNVTEDNCPCFHEQTRPLTMQFIEELSLWPDLMNQLDVEHGETIYGTRDILEMIHKNQNPENCREAKYIISGGWPYGFGSRIHMEGQVLAAAMNLGRVYLHHPSGDNIFWETSNPFCRNTVKDTTLTCFYEPFSKCTIEDAMYNYASDVDHIRTYHLGDLAHSFEDEHGLQQTIETLKNIKAFNIVLTTPGGGPIDGKKIIPHQILPIIACSPIRETSEYYIWRAMSASYLIRPNLPTRRMLALHHTVPIHDYRSCIATFVRHGDKGIEMKLLDFAAYRNIAEQMWNAGLVPASARYVLPPSAEYGKGSSRVRHALDSANSGRNWNWTMDIVQSYNPAIPFNGTLFITTEDPAVLAEATAWAKETGWTIAYTNLFDRASQTAYKTWDEQHKRGSRAVHDDLEYISMLLNLQYALQCEAWVCTLASNSCRVMDELRATIGGKANRHFADLSAETCNDPPCIENHGSVKQLGERRDRRDRKRRRQ
jgi:hypothetical protein